MKNLKIVMIVFLSCFTLFLCSMLGIALASGSGSGWFLHNQGNSTPGRYSLVQEKEIPIADLEDVLKEIHIDFGMNSHDVYFYQGDSDALVIREYLNYTPDEGGWGGGTKKQPKKKKYLKKKKKINKNKKK